MKDEGLSFFDHLDELRWRCLRILSVWVAATLLSFPFAKHALSFLILPLGKTYFFSPYEALFVQMKLALLIGSLATFPYFLWEGWCFVASGLLPNEKKYVVIYLPFSVLAFFSGLFVAYFLVLPLFLNFFLSFGSELLQPMISIGNYISFLSGFLLSFGILFEIPIAVLFLSHVGIVTPSFLVKKWPYGVLFVFIFAALITPPDVLSQLAMVGPIFLLYLVSLFFAWIGTLWKKKS